MQVLVSIVGSNYDGANHVIVEPTLGLISQIRNCLATAQDLHSKFGDFYCISFWDYTPIAVDISGLDDLMPDVTEEEEIMFDEMGEMKNTMILPRPVEVEQDQVTRMDAMLLTVTCNGFYWEMNDKYLGAEGHCETVRLDADDLDEWEKILTEQKCS